MKVRSIANKLLFAFGAIALLSLVAAIIGLDGFQRISNTQDSVVNKAVPILRDAHSLTELNSRIGASAQRMMESGNDEQLLQFKQLLKQQFQVFSPLLDSLKNQGISDEFLLPIELSVTNLQRILEQRTTQIGTQIHLQNELDSLSSQLIDNTVELNDMADSLVANAATTTTAVTSSLYDQVDDGASSGTLYEIFDRLIEVDIDALEKMYELRQRSANLNQIVSRVTKENQIEIINQLESRASGNVAIIQRRISEIIDPQRKARARQLLESVHLDAGPISISNIFTNQKLLIALQDQLAASEKEYNDQASRLNTIVNELSITSGRALTKASSAAQKSLEDSRQKFVWTAVAALFIMALILWRYVHHDVIRRLLILKDATLSIASGNLDHPVDDSGADELSEMARVLRLFRDNAIEKVKLDKELQQYKDNLEQTVRERTIQLEQTNARLAEEVAQHDIAREKAEQANQAKTDFLATISHELRTPLSGALGTLNLLRYTELSGKQLQYLNAVDTANSVLLDILDNVLGYSHVRAGKVELEHKAFDLVKLSHNVVSVMAAAAQEKGNTLDLQLEQGIPENLIGDSGKLTQVLMNLLGNASKFTEQGEIQLKVNLASFDSNTAILKFEVIDSGIGMDESRKEEMFKAFTQVDSSISRRYGGIGLGLAICRRLVDTMSGQIELESEPGKGTRIWFQLPFELSDKNEQTHPGKSHIRSSSQTVLMVEDDPTNREVTHSYLTHSGHTVVARNDGEAALAYLKKTIPDLILLDVSLPGVSGLDVLKKIRASNNPAIKNIAVIAMSAHVFEEEVATYLSAGMDGFLGKPFSSEDLDRAISRVQANANKPITQGKYHQPKHNFHNWKHSPLIEESVMKDDIALLGYDRVVQLLNILKSSGQEYLDQFSELEDQKTNGENSNVVDIAHRMRSATGNFGFLRLSALLQYIEKSDKDCIELLPDVGTLFQASIKAADELLERI